MVENKRESRNGSDSKSGGSLDAEQFRKLFIGGLSLSTTDDGLKAFYSQFGELLDCVVMRDNQTKKSRGFGFVSFSTKEEVDKAMDARPHEIDGKTVDPKRAVPRDQSSRSESNISTKRLYVSGVREEHTDDAFNNYFADFGTVVKVEIINDKVTQKPRGFAFITFDDYDAVDKCVLQKSHQIAGHRCDVKKALSKEDMAKAQQMDRDRQERSGRSRGMQRPGGGGGGANGGGQWGGAPGGRGGGGGYGGGGGGGYGAWGGAPQAGGWGGPPQGQWGPPGGGGGYGGGYGGYGGAAGGYGGGAPAAAGSWGGAAAGAAPAAAGGWGAGATQAPAAAGAAAPGSGGWGGAAAQWAGDAQAAQSWGAAAPGAAPAAAAQWGGGAAGGGWPAAAAGPPRY